MFPRSRRGVRRRRLGRDRRQPDRHRQQRRRQDPSALRAVGHALVEAGRRVLYTRTTDLVQRLQVARRDLVLEAALAKLDRFDLIILDDIGYAQKDQAETSVLFELIARRYETRSLAIAANQPFSAWDRIFPDQAVTVAAIDRLVHHATILEMNRRQLPTPLRADRSAGKADGSTTTTAGDNLADSHHHTDSDNLGDNIREDLTA